MPEAPHLQDPSGDYQTLQEFIPEARKKLNSNTWGYLVGATETETTMRRNRMALDSIAFRPRVCRDVSQVDLSTTFLNMSLRIPVMLAPVGSLESFHPGGGATAGRGASADHRQLGDQAGAGGDRQGGDCPEDLPALCAGRHRVDRCGGGSRDRCRLRRVLYHRRHRFLFAARARHGLRAHRTARSASSTRARW